MKYEIKVNKNNLFLKIAFDLFLTALLLIAWATGDDMALLIVTSFVCGICFVSFTGIYKINIGDAFEIKKINEI